MVSTMVRLSATYASIAAKIGSKAGNAGAVVGTAAKIGNATSEFMSTLLFTDFTSGAIGADDAVSD